MQKAVAAATDHLLLRGEDRSTTASALPTYLCVPLKSEQEGHGLLENSGRHDSFEGDALSKRIALDQETAFYVRPSSKVASIPFGSSSHFIRAPVSCSGSPVREQRAQL
ncbi:MAG: hypothetical protein AVDCRST_MAG28-3554 [uncultured Rubrobacteraceae bacterium]|uniref:Uncharacterized protein n=1 Tax=uncultured Rubrobacteraceae bacterium TaxID=349277 RepID=A0A6J4R990_9ACTN|nr:MAG: hypothetical protein AVDCRST_MAG28-3554 [uncultured Rubrobacteraceae bacterium]